MAVPDALTRFGGVAVPMVTPVTADGHIDVPAARRIVDHLIAGGVDAIFPLGTTGEAPSVHPTERLRLVATVVEHAAGRVPVLAGISGNALRESIEAAADYAAIGVTAVVAHAPYYYPLGPDAIEVYFRQLADAVPVPLVLYNIPKTTHVRLLPDTVAALAAHPNVAGLKDSAGDVAEVQATIHAVRSTGIDPSQFVIVLGATSCYARLVRGAVDGLVPGTSNLDPALYVRLWRAARAGRWPEVDALQAESDRLGDLYQSGRPLGDAIATLKALMADAGLCRADVLPPLQTRPATGGRKGEP